MSIIGGSIDTRPELQKISENLNENLAKVNSSINILNESVLKLDRSSTKYSKRIYVLNWILIILTAVLAFDVVGRYFKSF